MATRSAWQDVHLFVSSTFRDTQAERDVLVRRVFPVLRAELLAFKVRLIDIDLRWGIEGQDESGVVAVCMEVLEQALPRFIGIIGDRYGWIPPRSAVSVTEQEITAALGYETCYPLFLFRDPARPDGSESLDFLDDSDAGEDALQKTKKLSHLRTRIEESSTARVRRYQCSIREGKVVPDAVFETQALNGLRESLRSLYKTDDVPVEPAPSDTVGHALNFASERVAEWLGGLRDDELSHVTNFLKTNTGHIHIFGEGGSGKTSLLAKALDEIMDESMIADRVVLAAFCGAHRGAESGEAVLRGFADRMVDASISASDDHDPSRPPSDFDGLRMWFARRITDTKAVLLIDGIDQLPERDRFLTWLPNPLPDGVTVLTGSLDAASTTPLSEHWKARATDVITLAPLDNLSCTGFVTSQLTRYRKTLSEAALSALLAKPGASTPLYLRIAAEELRTKGVRENLERDISSMPGTAGGMFLWVLERLASDHQFRWSDGHRAVASLVGCLGVARDGLSEDELVALLSGIDTAGSDPTGDIAVLLQLLRPYLGRRGDRYAPLHRVFSEALHGIGITDADRSLLGSEHPAPLDELSEVQRAHAQLASLFAEMPADHFRRLSEEAWHRIHSGDLDGACSLLTDFSTLKSRVEAGLVRGVLEDMDALVGSASGADWPIPEELRVWQRLFRRRREFWEQFPDEFHQDCLNEAEGLPTTESAKAIPIDKPWIRWVNKPEHEIRQGWEWMVRGASCAALSPDGKTVAVGGTDGSLRLLEAETGYEIWKVMGKGDGNNGENSINLVAFSPDGSRVLTASWDKTARIWDASTGVELMVLRGHEDGLRSADFSPDGLCVLTAASDHSARIWDASTGSLLMVIRGHKAEVVSAVFSPDGSRVLTASWDDTVRIWDASTGSQALKLRARKIQASSAIFNPDGSRVLTLCYSTVRIWDASTGDELVVLRGNDAFFETAVFSADGSHVLTTLQNGRTIRVWDASTGAELVELRGHVRSVKDAVFSPNCSRVLTTSEYDSVRSWDLSHGGEFTPLGGHDGPVRQVAFSPDGLRTLTGSDDKTARVWDASKGAELLVLRGHERDVDTAIFNPDGSRVLTLSDSTVRIWDASTGAELVVLRGHRWKWSAVFRSKWSCNGVGDRRLRGELASSVVLGSNGLRWVNSYKAARVWDESKGVELQAIRDSDGWEWSTLFRVKRNERGTRFRRRGGWVRAAIFRRDGLSLIDSDDTVRRWDESAYAETAAHRGHPVSVWSVFLRIERNFDRWFWRYDEKIDSAAFSRDGSRVLTHGGETARIWDSFSGDELVELRVPGRYMRSAVFNSDESRVLTRDESSVNTASSDGTVRVWDASTGAELLVLEGPYGRVWSAVYSPDESQILAEADGGFVLWNASPGGERITIRGDGTHSLFFSSFSPDGSRLLTESSDGTVRIWDASTGAELLLLRVHTNWVNSAAFSPDGSQVLTASPDATLRIWDASTGTLLREEPPSGQLTVYMNPRVPDEEIVRENRTPVPDSDPALEYPSGPFTTLNTGVWLRPRGLPLSALTPVLHLGTYAELSGNPTDPLSFVAGCADGSVRFFRLEGVELSTFEQTSQKA